MTGWLMALYNNMTAEERERWAYAQGNVFLARMVAQTYYQVDDYAPMPCYIELTHVARSSSAPKLHQFFTIKPSP